MALTYTPIASTILSTAAANVTFTSIPGTFTDLVVRYSMRTNQAALTSTVVMTINGAATGNTIQFVANTPTNNTAGNILSAATGFAQASNVFAGGFIYLKVYASATQQTGLPETGGDAAGYTLHWSGTRQSTPATITSFTLTPASGSFVTYSRFDLYGTLKA
jgi:hypothetical protein